MNEFNDNGLMADETIGDTSIFKDRGEKCIIKVIGVGGGGCNAVNHMFEQNIPYVSFAVCNTDEQHLALSPVPCKILLGEGLGAGNDPKVGREKAEQKEDKILEVLNDGTQMVFVTAGMGGGTGTGAGPVVARIAKNAGLLTIGIVTVPFLFEGDKKILKAFKGAQEMQKHVDALLVINNENLVEIYKDLNLANAFEKADDTLTNAARSISEIISERCYINVDFRDVCTTLRDSGTAIISTAYGEGEHRISNAIENALHSPLLKKHDIQTSKRLLMKVSHNRNSENPVKMEEMNEITAFTAKLPSTIDVKWGLHDSPDLGDKVKITILASGFDVTLNKRDTLIPMDEQVADETQPAAEPEGKEEIEKMYGQDSLNERKRIQNRAKYIILKPSQYDDDEAIYRLESTCAFNRDIRVSDGVAHMETESSIQKKSDSPLQNKKEDENRDTAGETPAANSIIF